MISQSNALWVNINLQLARQVVWLVEQVSIPLRLQRWHVRLAQLGIIAQLLREGCLFFVRWELILQLDLPHVCLVLLDIHALENR